MRYSDAWPEDSLLEPKAVPTVETELSAQTVETLLKSAFPETELEDPVAPSVTVPRDVPSAKVVQSDTKLTPVWIAFAILALFSFYTITTLMNRIETLEAWLHGRMMSRP